MHVIACEIINDVITLANLLKSNFESYFFHYPITNWLKINSCIFTTVVSSQRKQLRRSVKTRNKLFKTYSFKSQFPKKG